MFIPKEYCLTDGYPTFAPISGSNPGNFVTVKRLSMLVYTFRFSTKNFFVECTVSRVLLKNIRSMLPENEFIRIHRSFIVAKSQITSFNKQAVMINSKTLLPIGRQYANDVISILSR